MRISFGYSDFCFGITIPLLKEGTFEVVGLNCK